ncbi:MAG: phosphoribosylglycinamide formyltransferase [Gammaproteobacteria bacterium]|nr:MAG: phosphoribosylglycinamide formyltransferase [Gammaproteobacteria bacterium]
MKKINLGFLASFRGTNMQAIIDACKSGRLAANPAVVISNNSAARALQRAVEEGIPAYHLGSAAYTDPEELDRLITNTLLDHEVELVILAGYMKKIGPCLLDTYRGRILNVHPSLLPRFGGKGMYGMHVHEAVIAAGEKESGATIHLVAGDYDTGPILAQRKVRVAEQDTPETLAERVLPVEHELYVDTISRIISGDLRLEVYMR